MGNLPQFGYRTKLVMVAVKLMIDEVYPPSLFVRKLLQRIVFLKRAAIQLLFWFFQQY